MLITAEDDRAEPSVMISPRPRSMIRRGHAGRAAVSTVHRQDSRCRDRSHVHGKLCFDLGVMTLAVRLAANLKKRRGRLSQEAFARHLGISRASLTRIESSGQNTTLRTLERIAKALRCEPADLFQKVPD
jgi:DNA-binding Xre family transcriptional regulator